MPVSYTLLTLPTTPDLILPTYAASLALKVQICRHWSLNPHPPLTPAIETCCGETVP
ncbi:malonate decarboxylase subunit alpha, partial [Streptomyces mexicanus]|uniref:malonate decarboxylase subunit alpha n=1 Tax=Streptomyces mexicanus TaxID=178566 RepID=UPI001357B214